MSEKNVVVLGAGYAGLQAAIELDKLGIPCTLIDKNNYHDLLPELPHRITDKKLETVIPLKGLIKNKKISFIQDKVKQVNYKKQTVSLNNNQEISFDSLVLALGTNVNYFGIQGLKENSFTFHCSDDVDKLLAHINNCFREAKDLDKNSDEYKELLTFVIGGGGLTGVEVLGEYLHELPKYAEAHGINVSDIKMYLIEANDQLLKVLDPPLSNRVTNFYKNKTSIELVLNTAIKEVKPNEVLLADERVIKSKTILWTGGIRANAFLETPYINEQNEEAKYELGRGFRAVVDEFYRVKGVEKTYAVGDNAMIIDAETGQPYPQNGQAAYKQGKNVAYYIHADLQGKPPKLKNVKLDGLMVSLGPKKGTGTIINPFTIYLPISKIARKIKKVIELRYKTLDIRR
ncbi:MAG TPA: NAD(P)/FAD-dependent oxidoreductase [Vampirovibrionales bacterium]